MKKNCLLFIFVVMMCCTGLVGAEKTENVIPLEDLMVPNGLAVSGDYMYVVEQSTIYIYTLKDFRLLKKFGKAGEGPREFITAPFGLMPLVIYPYDDKLLVNSNSRVSLFTREGTFIKEDRVPPLVVFLPFGDMFIATGSGENEKKQQVLSINIYDDKYQKKKELHRSDMIIGLSASFNYPITSFTFWGYKDKIYIASAKEGFVILVFDKNGNKLKKIKRDYKPLKVTKEYRDKVMDFYKNGPQTKNFWDVFKDRVSFKEFYPAIRDMIVRDGYIYVFTYHKKGNDSECIILDLEGNLKKQVFVPLPESWGDFSYCYDIRAGIFYSLLENEEDECWELHLKKLM